MGGGLMQLVAIGVQDVHLTGNPQISFFKVVYRRHTNFSMESIEQSFNGTAKPGNRVTCTISRNGDLVSNIWLEVTLDDPPVGHKYINSIGHALIEYVELEIGGQLIDKHYGEWLDIWSELTLPEEKRNGFKEMIGRRDIGSNSDLESNELYIPLQFFFCRNPGLALPLIALQYHEVKLIIQFRKATDLVHFLEVKEQLEITVGDIIIFTPTTQSITNTSTTNHTNVYIAPQPAGKARLPSNNFVSTKLFVDYIYLDIEERQRFVQMSHEYLIEQLQHTGPDSLKSDQVDINFNHPVKELIWVVRGSNNDLLDFGQSSTTMYPSGSMLANYVDIGYSNTQSDQFTYAKLQLNGHDRFTKRKASYFRLVQPYQHHTRVPNKHIYCYSFAINPESHQPSGTCNFSRLDNVKLILNNLKQKNELVGGELLVYAVSVNILKIISGMAGLAYSN
jgi:hypothetical protein